DYAASFGVPIINASWGGPGDSPVLDLAIADSDALFVAAAGNAGLNIDSDANDFFPAESTLANILSVAAIDQRGNRAPFSNYGLASVDIGAPGTNILSTYPGGHAWSAGTSMAAPHVSGVAALVASVMSGAPTPAALKSRILGRGTSLASMAGTTVTGRLLNAWRAVDIVGPTALPVARQGFNVGVSVGTTVSTTIVWPPATDPSGVASYVVRRRVGSGGWSTVASSVPTGKLVQTLKIGTGYRFGIAGRDRVGNVGPQADSPTVTALLLQDATSLARYAGRWSTVSSTTASNGRLHRSTRAGSSVEFRTSLRAVAVVGRKNSTNGQAKVYVDGAYVQTINLYRSSTQSKTVVFNKSWPTNGVHSVKLVVVGTAGHPGVDIDAFAILR
ncbi:MAG: S8 family serine peptidase, partial [Candidatus Limnocylindrales bacterium]